MRVDQDKLLRLALIHLAECVELVDEAPMRPTASLRLALAVAYSFRKSGDRAPFDSFWLQATDTTTNESGMAGYARSTHLMSRLRGVLRAVGIEPSLATEQPLLDAARKGLPQRKAARFNPLTQRPAATSSPPPDAPPS